MTNKIFAFCVIFTVGCISAQRSRTTFLDYFPIVGKDNVQKHSSNKKDVPRKHMQRYTEKSGHDLTFSRSWAYVLNNELKGRRYKGFNMALTDPDMFFRFGISAFMSPTITIENDRGFGPEPDKQSISVEDSYFTVLSLRQKIFYIITPSLTAPLIRYDLDLTFGSRLVVHTNMELRTGLGYEWMITYRHAVHDIYVLGDQLQDVYLPNDISSKSYLSQISTLDVNIRPIHFELNLSLSKNENRFSFGIGAIW